MRGLDVAPISTIHAFCQRVLTEHAFASGRLLAQSQVESRTAFAARVRRRHPQPPPRRELAPLLAAWLASGTDVDWLETLLYQGAPAALRLGDDYDPERVARAAARVRASCRRQRCAQAVVPRDQQQGTQQRDRRAPRAAAGRRCDPLRRRTPSPRGCSPTLDALVQATKDVFQYLLDPIGWPACATSPASRRCWRALEELADGGGSAGDRDRAALRPAGRGARCARASAPPATTTSTTCWRWSTRRCAARAAPSWRRRCARATGWRSSTSSRTPIRCSGRSSARSSSTAPRPRPLYRRRRSQAGDLRLPRRRRQHLRRTPAPRSIALGGVQLALERNFRSTPAVIDTYNAIFDQRAPTPFFSTERSATHHPVTYGGKDERDRSTACRR